MKLPITLLLTYQSEYEHTNITIAELCEKYSIKQTSLIGWQEWEKKLATPDINTEEAIATDIEILSDSNELQESPRLSGKVLATVTNSLPDTDLDQPKDITELLRKISQFKELSVTYALDFMENNAKYAEVKEIKDVVAIVDSIEKSFTQAKQPQGPTVHIAIQNLVERFRDDC